MYYIMATVKQLEELRRGPGWQSGLEPALEYPELPSEGEDEEHCYLLGWFLDDILVRWLEVAGWDGGYTRDTGLDLTQALMVAIHYMWNWGDYHHAWLTALPKDDIEVSGPISPAISGSRVVDDDVWFFAIGCSEETTYNRRPSKAQYEWIQKIFGTEPRWVLIDRSLYTIMQGAVWGRFSCCSRWVRHFASFST